MTGGAVNPLADNYSEDESIPPVHPTPTFEDVQLDGDVVYAPWGASFDITGVAKPTPSIAPRRSSPPNYNAALLCGSAT